MLKQWLKIIIFVFFPALLSAGSAYADLRVFACEPEWSALTQSLGGKHVTLYTATSNRQDPHHIQARPSLIAKARRADLLVCTGADLEIAWLPLLLRKSANTNIQPGRAGYFMASDHVLLLDKPTRLDRSEGDVHAAGNPHIHLDPERILQVATRLTHTLIKIDPSNQTDYKQNLSLFTQKWQNKISLWHKQTQALTDKSIVVHHNSWVYLLQWLGLNQVATLEPKSGIPPTSAHLSSLLSTLQQKPAHIIVHASYQDAKAANWLSRKTAIPIVALDFSPALDESLESWFDRLISRLSGAGA
ncbi:zinc ABC transporter substrate-binding protein [Candidatus Venteria ishoeyi]|uniref:metal ABC transporter substrate-binding protein n=1 Tax=Candidatus Venteria ishoeyi TaxID=1899563 RepID=UPI0025A54B60|nr:zinc ABC transporter substrate-binding protein [Candidatus Venteria ishoeyi]MDM8545701.1 zinc ABC transporter substrate-binding protein [Candidatus Venteria ishoeyi]